MNRAGPFLRGENCRSTWTWRAPPTGSGANPFLRANTASSTGNPFQVTYPYDRDGVHRTTASGPGHGRNRAGAFWIVSGYIEQQHLYGHYTALAQWTADMAWTDPAFRPVEITGFRYAAPPPLADGPGAGTPQNPYAKAKVDRFVVDPTTGTVSDPVWFQSMLHMRDERKTFPTLCSIARRTPCWKRRDHHGRGRVPNGFYDGGRRPAAYDTPSRPRQRGKSSA
jgi:hypothetical protein